jgi:uncharacterized membrane protein YhhN
VGRRAALGAVGFAAALVFLATIGADAPMVRLWAKPIPVLCLAFWVWTAGRAPSARPVTFGLLASALGDGLLEYGPAYFLPGLVAFLAAHLAYTAAFLRECRRAALGRAVPFVLWGVLGFLAMRRGLGPLAGPVVVYLAAICTMMWRAAAGVGRDGKATLSEWLAVAGAVLFGMSDTLIGLDRFRAPLEGARVPIMVLYWLGQIGIAASTVPRPLGYAPGPEGKT